MLKKLMNLCYLEQNLFFIELKQNQCILVVYLWGKATGKHDMIVVPDPMKDCVRETPFSSI